MLKRKKKEAGGYQFWAILTIIIFHIWKCQTHFFLYETLFDEKKGMIEEPIFH